MSNEPLCRVSVQKMEGMPAPHKMGSDIIKTTGPAAVWSITNAFLKCQGFCLCSREYYDSAECKNCSRIKWTGSCLQWLEITKWMEFIDF